MASHPVAFRICIVILGLAASGDGDLYAQLAPQPVSHAAAGISMTVPAGWAQILPPAKEELTGAPRSSAAERQSFLERTADLPRTTFFLFAKDLNVVDPQETPSILIRVQRVGPLGQRPVADIVAAMAAQRDPRMVGPIRIGQVSGLPAIHATLRETARVGGATFSVMAHGHFVSLGTVMLVIDMKAPESSPEATNQVFAEALASIGIER